MFCLYFKETNVKIIKISGKQIKNWRKNLSPYGLSSLERIVLPAIVAKMHFCVHFPKENVQLCKNVFGTFYYVKRTHYILLRKMFSTAVQKCLFAYILRSQMWCQNVFWQSTAFWRTFYEVKCSAKQRSKMFSNVIVRRMHGGEATIARSAMLCEAKIVPDAKMYLMLRTGVQKGIFARRTFYKVKCSAQAPCVLRTIARSAMVRKARLK